MQFLWLGLGIVVLWLWWRGNLLGSLGVFVVEVFLFGPGSHQDWSWTNPDDVKLIALFAAVGVAPILFRYRRPIWKFAVDCNEESRQRHIAEFAAAKKLREDKKAARDSRRRNVRKVRELEQLFHDRDSGKLLVRVEPHF